MITEATMELTRVHKQMRNSKYTPKDQHAWAARKIYDKYDRIVKSCRICSTSAPTPPRAGIAGLRASSFADLIFVDHETIKHDNKAYLALVITDGASNLLWATALKGLEAPETLGAFCQWTEANN